MNNIAVLGAGIMGHGAARLFLEQERMYIFKLDASHH